MRKTGLRKPQYNHSLFVTVASEQNCKNTKIQRLWKWFSNKIFLILKIQKRCRKNESYKKRFKKERRNIEREKNVIQKCNENVIQKCNTKM